jgi:2-polyprenyl-3-methyl-5-hydroxy-6-metoxy-1,4-benzoquinol methylase
METVADSVGRNGPLRKGRVNVSAEAAYLLGHSELEHRRLTIQSHYLRPLTSRFFLEAGLTQGMTVLDAGSGLGDAALVAAEIVGPAGRVVGVERDEAAVNTARARIDAEGLADTVSFHSQTLDEFQPDGPFDALVGRFVLQYQPDPAATLRRLASFVRPGGIIVFHDMDFSNEVASWPPCELWDTCYGLLAALFNASAVPPDFGRRLARVFLDAGLPWPQVEISGLPGGGPGSTVYAWLGSALQAVKPLLDAAEIECPADVAFDRTLPGALERAALDQGSLVMGSTQYGAWTRVPWTARPYAGASGIPQDRER